MAYMVLQVELGDDLGYVELEGSMARYWAPSEPFYMVQIDDLPNEVLARLLVLEVLKLKTGTKVTI